MSVERCVVHTARVSYGGADRLDVTRAAAGPDGIAFAPTWAILRPALALRELHNSLRARNPHGVVEVLDARVWDLYAAAYAAEMRLSYREQRAAWDALLARAEVTLLCYCTDAARCHRTVLAGILAKLGATNAGERHV